ncbi:hypothetical protein IPJ72_04035 [Candidatus Peregrinibacteria bacterium]|nr:MAG: hypothetical protein IPJ72_04035 [Candidatus Peregrinibacteria bacterium]
MIDFFSHFQTAVHYGFHLIVPGLVARVFFKSQWKVAWLIMVATMVVDLDHLVASPIFDPHRCSIGFHPLHSLNAHVVYVLMMLIPNTYVRMAAIGLLFHMVTDLQDCIWMGL